MRTAQALLGGLLLQLLLPLELQELLLHRRRLLLLLLVLLRRLAAELLLHLVRVEPVGQLGPEELGRVPHLELALLPEELERYASP